MNKEKVEKESRLPHRVLYAEAVYGQEEIDAVVEVLKNRPHQLMTGQAVSEFEDKISSLFGKKHGIMTNSGSSANMLAIASLNLPEGSEVITPACTFSTTVAPLVQNNLVPSFVDIEIDTFVVDPDEVEKAITPKTRAMMIPNLIGNLADWPKLREIADKHNLTVIEDSADTIGSLVNGEPTGQLTDISTTSFYASHVMTCAGFGGMVCFNDSRLAQRALLLRGWGRSSTLTNESENIEDRFSVTIDGTDYDSKFIFEGIGYNFLPSEIGAAFGLVQLERLDEYIENRRYNFNAIREFFTEYENWFILPKQTENTTTAWLAVPLIVRDSAPFSRLELQKYLEGEGIQTRPIFSGNILRHSGFKKIERVDSSSGYPNSDRVLRGGILLGCHQGMEKDQIDYICSTFTKFAKHLMS